MCMIITVTDHDIIIVINILKCAYTMINCLKFNFNDARDHVHHGAQHAYADHDHDALCYT